MPDHYDAHLSLFGLNLQCAVSYMKKSMTIIIFFIVFLLFTSLWGFYISIRPPRITSSITPQSFDIPYENVSFQTQDGLTLKGWFVPRVGPDTSKTIIVLHGYPADKGDVFPVLAFLSKDFNLFLFDFRYLGESGGKYSTTGAKEVQDLLGAILFLKERGIDEVGVWGFSMGGAVALMTQEKTPEIKAVVSESAYANLGDLGRQLYRLPVLNHALGYLTTLWGRIIIGINAFDVSPEKSVRQSKIPIFIIHSKNDELISFSHALRLQEALKQNPRAEFWFEENLIHGALGSNYQERVRDFFVKHL